MYIASDGIHTAVIQQDRHALNPRDPDVQENLGTIICWHRKYRLGDQHDHEDPNSFFRKLASTYLTAQDLVNTIQSGKLENYRFQKLTCDQENPSDTAYVLQNFCDIPGLDPWQNTDWYYDEDSSLHSHDQEDLETLLDIFSSKELFQLLDHSNKVALLPLYLYDHGGLSISTTSYYDYYPHAEWDSGCVGYIYMDQELATQALRMPDETIRVTRALTGPHDRSVMMVPGIDRSLIQAAGEEGYLHISSSDIQNPDFRDTENPTCSNRALYPHWLEQELLFRKGHTLYVMGQPDTPGVYHPLAVADFAFEHRTLTEDTWKKRAEDYLKTEVAEYDNYLTGHVYKIDRYNGRTLCDSIGDFNPGSSEITDCFPDMLDGWHPELSDRFRFEYNDSFDIEEYFANNHFPDYRASLKAQVASIIQQQKDPYPFAVEKTALFHNKDGYLDQVTDLLYESHTQPTFREIFQALIQTVGLTRELRPRLSATDLRADRDYTEDELLKLLQQKKSSLSDIIAAAEAKAASWQPDGLPPVDRSR